MTVLAVPLQKDNPSASADLTMLRLSPYWYRRGEWEAQPEAGPSPPYTTGFGARVARQRCLILRAGTTNLPLTTLWGKLPAGTHKATNARRERRWLKTRVHERSCTLVRRPPLSGGRFTHCRSTPEQFVARASPLASPSAGAGKMSARRKAGMASPRYQRRRTSSATDHPDLTGRCWSSGRTFVQSVAGR